MNRLALEFLGEMGEMVMGDDDFEHFAGIFVANILKQHKKINKTGTSN